MSETENSCCTGPQQGGNAQPHELASAPGTVVMPPPVAGPRQVAEHAVPIPGGRAFVGTGRTEVADDGEGPVPTRARPPGISTACAATRRAAPAGTAASAAPSPASAGGKQHPLSLDVIGAPSRLENC